MWELSSDVLLKNASLRKKFFRFLEFFDKFCKRCFTKPNRKLYKIVEINEKSSKTRILIKATFDQSLFINYEAYLKFQDCLDLQKRRIFQTNHRKKIFESKKLTNSDSKSQQKKSQKTVQTYLT